MFWGPSRQAHAHSCDELLHLVVVDDDGNVQGRHASGGLALISDSDETPAMPYLNGDVGFGIKQDAGDGLVACVTP